MKNTLRARNLASKALANLFNFSNNTPWGVIGTDGQQQQIAIIPLKEDCSKVLILLNFGDAAMPTKQLKEIILPRLRNSGILKTQVNAETVHSDDDIAQSILITPLSSKPNHIINDQIKITSNNNELILKISTKVSARHIEATATEELFNIQNQRKKQNIHYL